MTYNYSKISEGYRWNAMQRIRQEVGIEPESMSDAGEETIVGFNRELSIAEKEKLDALMSDDPQLPPKDSQTVLIIDDLYECFAEFERIVPGLRLFYTQSEKYSNETSQIELHHRDKLSEDQVKAIKEKYISLFK